CRTATVGDGTLVFLAEAELVHLLLEEEGCVAHILDLHPTHHLAHNDLNVLVRDGDTLEPVDFLDFVDQVALEFALTEHGQNVVRVERTIHERLASANAITFLHVDVHAARHGVFLLGTVIGGDVDLALTFADLAELHHTIDLADDCGLARLAGFEELDDARQTTGDVLGLGGFTRNLSKHIARKDLVTILDHEVSARRHQVTTAALATFHDDGGLALFIRRLTDNMA